MVNLNFNVLGINNITSDSTQRFTCVTSDGNSLYLGSESTNSIGHVWKYSNNSWSKITGNLENENLKAITSLIIKKGVLYASTGGSAQTAFGTFKDGQVWSNSNGSWNKILDDNGYTSYLRKLIKINDNLYTAGTFIYVLEYKNNSWNFVYNGFSDIQNMIFFIDLETDGTNLFACGTGLGKNSVNILKYNGSTWDTATANEVLGDTNNDVIVKLCWYNGKLYAATYNETTGTQIHLINSDKTTTKINTDGFGSRNNYTTSNMKVIDGNLVVSTENNFGAEIWAYNLTDGWVKQTVSTNIKYLSYLIESAGGKNYVIGKDILKLESDSTTVEYQTARQRIFKDIPFWPEGGLGAVPIGINKYKFFGGNNKNTLITQGPLTDPLKVFSNNSILQNSYTSGTLPSPVTITHNINSSSIQFSGDANLPGVWTERLNHDSSETDPYVAFPAWQDYIVSSNFDPRGPDQIIGQFYLKFPQYFNALHLGIIPKGPHRGKVVMMNSIPAVGIVSSLSATNPNIPWSFQSWSIYDPSPSAGTPERPRFLNYLLPISPVENFSGVIGLGTFNTPPFNYYPGLNPITFSEDAPGVFANLFCGGHTWSPSGDWIVAGGSKWGFKYFYGGASWADQRTYSWNPAAPGSFKSGPISGTDIVSSLSSYSHYSSAGSWTRGPNLNILRWYPTVTHYPNVTRTSNLSHALVLGGDSTLTDYPNIAYDSYESLVISSIPTSSNPGFGLDVYNGSSLFDGPSDRQISSLYVVTPSLGVTGVTPLWNDSFYFYPRTFVTSAGYVTFAGMTHRSSFLPSHDTSAGTWSSTIGHDEGGVGVYDKYRHYGTSFRMPNINGIHVDTFYRIGGADLNKDPITGEVDTTKVDVLTVSSNTAQWKSAPETWYARTNGNAVILPDASVFSVGGEELMTDRFMARTSQASQPFQYWMHPVLLSDHHVQSNLLAWANVSSLVDPHDLVHDEHEHGVIDTSMGDDIHPLDVLVKNYYDISETGSEESVPDPLNPVNSIGWFRHLIPEILNPETLQWEQYDWAKHKSWRDYHSAAILLPDGRVLISGGENRHNSLNGYIENGIGYDYEIFSPKYLRPTQNENDNYARPTGVGMVSATYNSDPQVECCDLDYGQTYALSCNYIRPHIKLEKVVFMAPGSVTHHTCYNQRYFEVEVTKVSDTKLEFTLPSNCYTLPPGFYMVFAMTNQKIPAEAIWIRIKTP